MTITNKSYIDDRSNMAVRATEYQDVDGNVLAQTNVTDTPADNALMRADGTGGNIQSTSILIDDSDNISAVNSIDSVGYNINSVGTLKIGTASLTATELGGTETNTSFSFPATGAILLNAWIDVTDAETGTIDVGTQGTSNDPDGILDGISVATLGYVGQDGTNEGALLNRFITGSDPVSVTASGDLNSCEATLYILYIELP